MSNPVNRDNRVNGGVSANNDQRNRSENPAPNPLIQSLQDGDPAAYDKLVELKDASLKRFLFRVLNSREDAEEIAQDVFIHIWKNRDYLSKVVSFDGYLFNIAYRKALNRIVENERFHNLLLEEYHRPVDYADSPEEIAEVNDLQARIDKTIDSMPAVMRRIYVMKYQKGLSNDQIAQTLSITIGTVRVQVSRAERRVREAVFQPPDERF